MAKIYYAKLSHWMSEIIHFVQFWGYILKWKILTIARSLR